MAIVAGGGGAGASLDAEGGDGALGDSGPAEAKRTVYKLLTKLLTIRLQKVIMQLIHANQYGFICSMCNSSPMESITHLFFSCPFAVMCWQYICPN
jgi:hypothetical protein